MTFSDTEMADQPMNKASRASYHRSVPLAGEEQVREALDHPVFHAVSEIAEEKGTPAYVIGGWVRDLLLKKECKDIDLVVVGNGIDLAHDVAERLGGVQVNYFKHFGTAMLRYEDLEVEFVGARKESYSADSRKPAVENGTLEDDQNRRDLTINALAFSLNKEDHGQLIDPFGGLEDLKNGVVRTPKDPDLTFSDDPLRMMRAIRFSTQLMFHIEETTLQAIERNRDRIKIVSMERVTTELNKIIEADRPSHGFKLLFKAGLLTLIFPEMAALQGVDVKDQKGHKDNFFHTLQVLDNVAQVSDDLWLRWAAILHDIGKPPTKRFDKEEGWTFHGHDHVGAKMVPRIFRRLKLPLDSKMKYVRKLVALHLRPIALTQQRVTDSAVRRLIYEAGEDLEDLMKLCKADITSKNEKKVQRYLKNYDKVAEKILEVEEKDRVRNFQPPVSGEEIMEAFGISPSRQIGEIKEAIKEAILDGEIPNDREAAWDFMIRKGKRLGLTPRE